MAVRAPTPPHPKDLCSSQVVTLGVLHQIHSNPSTLENTSYSQKLHIPASPSDQESLTTSSGKPETTLSPKYMPQPGIPDS